MRRPFSSPSPSRVVGPRVAFNTDGVDFRLNRAAVELLSGTFEPDAFRVALSYDREAQIVFIELATPHHSRTYPLRPGAGADHLISAGAFHRIATELTPGLSYPAFLQQDRVGLAFRLAEGTPMRKLLRALQISTGARPEPDDP